MRMREAVRKHAVSVDAATTVVAAAEVMDRSGVGTVLVTDGGRLVGIVTDRDIVVRGVARRSPLDARIDAVMSTELQTIDADADLHDAAAVFAEHPVRRLPVVDGDDVVGVLTVDDFLVDLVDDMGRVLRPVTAQTIFAGPEPRAPMQLP
jgi:CBS domain-containing protein